MMKLLYLSHMIKGMTKLLRYVKSRVFHIKRIMVARYFSRNLYVMLDPDDSSITFSRNLVRVVMALYKVPNVKIMFAFVFRNESSEYAFMVNRFNPTETLVADIQYNPKERTAGFQSAAPSVYKILTDYGLLSTEKAFLPVSVRKTVDGYTFFLIKNTML